MASTVALWIFGLLASAIFGAMIGNYLASGYEFGGFWGLFGGMFAFSCARLWWSSRARSTR